MSQESPSITYFIATTGRPSLENTVRSLYGQFGWGIDKIKIFVDGPQPKNLDFMGVVSEMYNDRDPGSLEIVHLDENLGFWGHGIRNKYQTTFATDYVHNMDDDDAYVDGHIPLIRNKLSQNFGKVLICKFKSSGNRVVWQNKIVKFGEIGTPSGLIPNRPEVFGEWGYEYGGDFKFYSEVQNHIGKENIVFTDLLIVNTRPHDTTWNTPY